MEEHGERFPVVEADRSICPDLQYCHRSGDSAISQKSMATAEMAFTVMHAEGVNGSV